MRNKFEIQVAALKQAPSAALCYGVTEYYRINEEVTRRVFAGTDRPIERVFPAFLRARRWGTSSPLYRRSVTDRIGPWGGMWSEEDWEYDCRIGALGLPVAHVNRVVSVQRGLVGQRLSQRGRDDVKTLAGQAEARTRIYHCAKRAGVSRERQEMTWFLRGLFLLARDCGGNGLLSVASDLLDIVMAETADPSLRRKVAVYRGVAAVVGWESASRAARFWERRLFRSRSRGSGSAR
jgi:hypothetical protein